MHIGMLVVLATCALVLGPAASSVAHEQRDVSGLELVVGWAEEPAYVGFRNAVTLSATDGAGNPREDLDLRVEVTLGDSSTGPLDMDPAFGEPGAYRADLIPTAPGAYTFRFTGTIDGTELDEEFTAGEETFDEVHEPSAIQFPTRAPTNPELAERIETVAASADTIATDAGDSAATARTMALLALVLGAIGALLGLGAFLRKW